MIPNNIKIDIPFNSLLESIKKLSIEEKFEIWNIINLELDKTEEEFFIKDPQMRLEIKEAKEAYEAGDFLSIDEFINKQKK